VRLGISVVSDIDYEWSSSCGLESFGKVLVFFIESYGSCEVLRRRVLALGKELVGFGWMYFDKRREDDCCC